ncbi:hypothetical protein pb186bvf_018839 [Paramecium bursaria]
MFTKAIAMSFKAPSQLQRVQTRLLNQHLISQFRLCSTLSILKIQNEFCTGSASLPDDSDGTYNVNDKENEIESVVSRILSVTLKSNMVRRGKRT